VNVFRDSIKHKKGFAPMFPYQKYPRKINLGCGFDHKDDCLNVDLNDFHNPDLKADVCELDMLPDDYYTSILAKDVLEHIRRDRVDVAVKEWFRILKPGGTISIQTVNVLNLSDLMRRTNDYVQLLVLTQCMFGTQAYTGDFHYVGFTPITIERLLREVGFQNIVLVNLDHWLMQVTAKKPSSNESLAAEVMYSFGFYNEERAGVFRKRMRWSTQHSQLVLNNAEHFACVLVTSQNSDNFRLLYSINDSDMEQIQLSSGSTKFSVDIKSKYAVINFYASDFFCPAWRGESEDSRWLSFCMSDVKIR
jgi:SAM-dependent methyltransferase